MFHAVSDGDFIYMTCFWTFFITYTDKKSGSWNIKGWDM